MASQPLPFRNSAFKMKFIVILTRVLWRVFCAATHPAGVEFAIVLAAMATTANQWLAPVGRPEHVFAVLRGGSFK